MPPRRKSPLRPVAPGETAPRQRPKTVIEAATKGTTRELLSATRDRIAVAVENPNTPARDLAALTKRLMETVREIEQLDAREAEESKGAAAPASDEAFDATAL